MAGRGKGRQARWRPPGKKKWPPSVGRAPVPPSLSLPSPSPPPLLIPSLPPPPFLARATVYAQVKKYQDTKYAKQGAKVEKFILDSIKKTQVVTIDTKHPNKTALVAQIKKAVAAVDKNLGTPIIAKP